MDLLTSLKKKDNLYQGSDVYNIIIINLDKFGLSYNILSKLNLLAFL